MVSRIEEYLTKLQNLEIEFKRKPPVLGTECCNWLDRINYLDNLYLDVIGETKSPSHDLFMEVCRIASAAKH